MSFRICNTSLIAQELITENSKQLTINKQLDNIPIINSYCQNILCASIPSYAWSGFSLCASSWSSSHQSFCLRFVSNYDPSLDLVTNYHTWSSLIFKDKHCRWKPLMCFSSSFSINNHYYAVRCFSGDLQFFCVQKIRERRI